jgi:WS/DGAT/MGAT family acyltransferase
MHGASVAVFEGEIPFDDVYASMEARLPLVPRYRQRLAFVPFNLGHPKWVDDPDFRLENHVKLERLPAGATLKDATEHALRLGRGLLDRDRPLWRTYILEGVPDRTVMVSLGHHAMVDGVTGVDLLTVLMDFEPDAKPPPPPAHPWQPEAVPSPLELIGEALRENTEAALARNPWFGPTPFAPGAGEGSARRAELLQRASEVALRLMTRPVIGAPWNAAPVAPERKLAWFKRAFSDIRAIRNVYGGTLNDVVLTVTTEAAARYLEAHGEYVRDQSLRLMCPVNVRREDERGALGNRVSALFPTLPAWSMKPVERLQAVREEMNRLKANQEAQALELLMEASAAVPPVAMAQTLLVGTPFDPGALLARFPPPIPRWPLRPPHLGYNFVVTNVPGVQVPLYLVGHKLLDLYAIMMLSGNVGLGIAVTSYDQRLYFSLTSDARLLPDVDRLGVHAENVFDELLAAAAQAGKSASAA